MGLAVGRVLANVTKQYVPVRVMNLSTQTVVIRPNTHLADGFLVQEVLQTWKGGQERSQNTQIGVPGACQIHEQGVSVPTAGCVDLSEAAMDGEEQRSRLEELVEKNGDVFSKHSLDYGHTTTVQHEIPLVDPKPF